jgi:myo-inositol-1(or 4)-monophosphatase
MNPPIDNAAVEALLRDLGRYQLEGYRGLGQADIAVKDDVSHGYSVVTQYDVESERRVFEFVEKRHPGDSFLGEENGNVKRHPRRYWVLDPIDGTSNYTQGVPFWGPSLAYWDERGPERGWVYFPALDQMFFASRGGGAWLDGKRLETSRVAEYSNLCSVATVSRLHRRFRLRCPAKHRILGSIIVNLAYVATGTFAASYCRGSVWDLAAGILIAREAGAVVECEPDFDSIDLTGVDPQNKTSISVYATANATLPGFKRFIEAIPDPITGK